MTKKTFMEIDPQKSRYLHSKNIFRIFITQIPNLKKFQTWYMEQDYKKKHFLENRPSPNMDIMI